MDRISQLPDFIVHHILSFINTPVDLVRMSVLSKNWFHLTASFPILDFNIRKFTKGLHVSRQSFFKYVEYTTSRFCHQNVTAHTFKIITTLREPAELDIVNRCLELVLKNGVRELEIHITNTSARPMPKCRLPNVLLSVSVLESLSIRGCELPSSLMVDVVKFKSLTKLKLEFVSIDDEVIKYLTTRCPLLKEFYLKRCHGFKIFCVYGHQNLQKVWIQYKGTTPVEVIDIEAPNLFVLFVVDHEGRGAPRMNFASCKNLTTVSYYGYPLPNSNGFTDFLSNFPFIVTLFLATKYKSNNIKFTSHSLRTLVLKPKCDLEEIEFSTPNLVVFNYSSNVYVPSPLLMDATHLKACMQYYPDPSHDIINAHWFHKLRLFLDKNGGFKVLNLYIDAMYCAKCIELEDLKAIGLQPYELEHLELQLDTNKSSDHVSFVDALLWCCRPQSLTISFCYGDFEVQSDFVKFTYEKLLEQEDEGHTSIQIVSPSPRPLMALLPGGKTITFIKEKGALG